ncbi:MAG TPA: aminotransferase class I/II-fold pyridoxal phosphate-dependent enzyme [Flavobacteriales bacterium]|nr:aminotransferase class I/II-fold pyridoxal phosphate-dependent enzyme [Flavobacteriales bacterium]
MNIRTFDLERIQSLYENTVEFNLTESGFHPLQLDEILDEQQLRQLAQLNLGYGQTNGDPRLRDRIAGLYENAGAGNVLVTNGSAEANFVAAHTLLNAGDEVVIMIPNYMQLWGIVEEMLCTPVAFHMREENNWAPDLEELARVVNPKTKMIAVCNPNNPTGYVLTSQEMEAIVAIAREHDAWIYSDEIYRGAELNYTELESFYGKYDKVMVNGGLSKSYALPGLRLGWLVGPEKVTDNAWTYRDYTSICSSLISQYVAEIVLRPKNREKILNRNRKMLNENLVNLQTWLDKHGDVFSFIPPQAGGMAFMSYDLDINSTDLSHWLREQESVFIIPGDCYGMDGYIRIGVGERSDFLLAGLEKMSRAIQEKFKLRTI